MNAIKKNKAVQLGTNETLSDRAPLLDQIANKAYEMVLENKFDRGDELDADNVSRDADRRRPGTRPSRSPTSSRASTIATRISRSATACSRRIQKRKSASTRSGSSPAAKTGALVEARYKANVKYEPTPVTSIATVADGAAGLTGSTKPAKRATRATTKARTRPRSSRRRKGSASRASSRRPAPERQSAQVSASGGSRGLGPDRAAKGGANSALVKVTVTDAEVGAFKKGIA